MSDIERKAAAFDWLSERGCKFQFGHDGNGFTFSQHYGKSVIQSMSPSQLECVEMAMRNEGTQESIDLAIKVDQEQQ